MTLYVIRTLFTCDHLPYTPTILFESTTLAVMAGHEDEDYEVPLRDQRYFGSGLIRKRVQFVASSGNTPAVGSGPQAGSSKLSASQRYLAIVMKKAGCELSTSPLGLTEEKDEINALEPLQRAAQPQQCQSTSESDATIETCAVCRLPISVSQAHTHGSSIAHQVCLPHAYPPSSIDRQRKGLDILQSYGWDPDQRLGLGATGEGILHPIKAKEKRDRIGLGVAADDESRSGKRRTELKRQPVQKLDAGKIRKLDAEGRKRDKKMRDLFYRNEEVEKYLGGGD